MASSQTNDDDDGAATLELIDVDCNLWHADLKAFLAGAPGGKISDDDDDDTNNLGSEIMSNPWKLLKSDAMNSSDGSSIVAAVTPCSTLTESRRAVATLQHYYSREKTLSNQDLCQLGTTLGVHPYHVNDDDLQLADNSDPVKACMDELRSLYQQAAAASIAEEEKSSSKTKKWVVAMGECGLDQAPGFPPLEQQLPWFEAQVELSQELHLPLFVHERLASEQTLQVLKDLDKEHPVIIHCFTGNSQELESYLECGYFISFAGGFLAKQAVDENASDVCKALPRLWPILENKLMLETDAPYMGFADCRKLYLEKHAGVVAALSSKKRKRLQSSTYPNVPSSLEQVLFMVHAALNANDGNVVTRRELAQITTRNAQHFFGFS